jgi:[ribosomal protein S18]-alanine N-acetyltransferase
MSAPAGAAESATLREANALDVAMLAELHAACFEDGWDAAAMAALLAVPGTAALLMLFGERPVGFIMTRAAAGEAEILTIGVDPTFRRRNLGTRLIEAACAAASDAGAATMFLEVAEDDPGARRFYGGAGFQHMARRRRYYRRSDGRRVDALVLRRMLSPAADGANGQNSTQTC